MYEDLKNQVVLISGSGKKTGIGYAMARAFARQKSRVVIADYGKPESFGSDVETGTMEGMNAIAGNLSKEFDTDVIAVNLDVTDAGTVEEMIAFVTKRFERIDVLCNNAGATFGVPNGIHTYDETAWLKTMDVNLNGVFRVSKAVVPLMQQHGGRIINTASRAGKVPPLFNGAYAVSKAGVIMLTKVMARELAGLNIRVNAICPGQVMTDLEKWRFELQAKFLNTTPEQEEEKMCQTIPMGRIGRPDEVADLALFLASGASSYITGQAVNICGGQVMEL